MSASAGAAPTAWTRGAAGPSRSAPAGSELLALTRVSAGYRGVPVVQDVSLSVGAGEISLVVGPNGAGKSTLVKTAIGELEPLGGRIVFAGQDVSSWGEERRARSLASATCRRCGMSSRP